MIESARRQLPALAHSVRGLTKQIAELRAQILGSTNRYTGMEQDVGRLAPPDFPARTPHERLHHLPRYLKAILVRAERAALHPARDAEKARLLAPFIGRESTAPPATREAYRWLLEEYRVSIFAQELGTSVPVSPKRLEALLG
jgi:ATP-dependent helicase HrpA